MCVVRDGERLERCPRRAVRGARHLHEVYVKSELRLGSGSGSGLANPSPALALTLSRTRIPILTLTLNTVTCTKRWLCVAGFCRAKSQKRFLKCSSESLPSNSHARDEPPPWWSRRYGSQSRASRQPGCEPG